MKSRNTCMRRGIWSSLVQVHVLPVWYRTITWTNSVLLQILHLGTNTKQFLLIKCIWKCRRRRSANSFWPQQTGLYSDDKWASRSLKSPATGLCAQKLGQTDKTVNTESNRSLLAFKKVIQPSPMDSYHKGPVNVESVSMTLRHHVNGYCNVHHCNPTSDSF